MKWFKHMSSFRNRKEVASIIDHGGLEAYGAFCMTCEVIAEQMGSLDIECKQELSTRRWTILLGIPRAKFHKILETFKKSELLVVSQLNDEDETVSIAIPILAELRDEYSRKSGHCPDNVRPMSPLKEKRRSDHIKSDSSLGKSSDEGVDSGDAFRGKEGFTQASDIVQMCLRNAQES